MLDFPYAVAEVCKVATFGAEKYSRYNWKNGLPISEIEDSLLRHLSAFHSGEDLDAESGMLHMAHVAWNALAILEIQQLHPEFDNRDIKNKEEEANE